MKRLIGFLTILFAYGLIGFSGHLAAADSVSYTGKPITLRFSSHIPPNNQLFQSIMKPWLKMVNEESGGKIKIKLLLGGLLHGSKDGFKACAYNITDITHAYPSWHAGSFQLFHELYLPYAFPNAFVGSMVSEELYPKYLKGEYEKMGVYLANVHTTSPYNLLAKKPIQTLEDIKGMKIRSGGGISSDIIEALGAVPVFVTTAEIYNAFQRGIVDAVLLYDAGMVAFRLHEIGRYRIAINVGVMPTPYAMNRKKFDSMPPELKRILYRLMRKLSQLSAMGYTNADEWARNIMKRKGIKTIHLDKVEYQRWQSALQKIWETFIDEKESNGLPARALLGDMKQLVEKYSKMTSKQLMDRATTQPVSGIIDGM